MARGATLKHIRKAGAFSNGELAAGEWGLDTTNGVWYYSANGTTVVALPAAVLTLTNKRIQPRRSSAASGDVTPDLSTASVWVRTALSAGIAINAPTGTPVADEVIVIRLKDDGSSRALTWNSTYKPMGAALPTATTTGKRLIATAQFDGTDWLTLTATEI